MKRYRFEGAIQPGNGWGAFVLFPHDVEKEFGTRGKVNVQALLDGVPYAGALMRCGMEYHMLGVPKTIREQLGKQPGDLIKVDLWKDDVPRTVELPDAFITLLQKEKLLEGFGTLSVTRRKEYRNWLESAKKDETRQRRMTKAIEMLRCEIVERAAKKRIRG